MHRVSFQNYRRLFSADLRTGKTRFRTILSVLMTFGILTLSACSFSAVSNTSADSGVNDEIPTPATAPPVVLTIGTADTGGSMFPAGTAIANALEQADSNLKINVSASSGSVTNVTDLIGNRFDMALVSGDTAFEAYNEQATFAGKKTASLRAIGAVYSSMSNWIAPKSLRITYVHDLRDQLIANGPAGSSTDRSGHIVLEALGISSMNQLVNMGYGDTLTRLTKKEISAVHGFAGIPVASLTETSDKIDTQVLAFEPEELQRILGKNPAYRLTTIPAGTYRGQTKDVDTFGINCLLCVSETMDDATVQKITQTLIRSSEQLAKETPVLGELKDPGFLCTDLPIPLHPGAEKAYREAGLLK